MEIIEKTKPVNILPIHYWIPGITLPLKPVDEFLKHVKEYEVVKLETNSFELEKYTGKVIVAKPP